MKTLLYSDRIYPVSVLSNSELKFEQEVKKNGNNWLLWVLSLVCVAGIWYLMKQKQEINTQEED